jgi:hypothetical protein
VKDLSIPLFEFSTGSVTQLLMNGKVKGLPDVKSAYFDVNLSRFTTAKADIYSLVRADLLPANISIPERLDVRGFFRGVLNNFNGQADVRSSFGNLLAQVTMKQRETYDAMVNVDHFDLGKLLRQPETLGPVTLKAKVSGQGFSPETMKGTADVKIQQAVLKQYNYHNISVAGNFAGKQFDGNASVQDSNLALHFKGLLDFDPDHPYYKARLELEGADLQAMHLTTEDLRISGLLTTDIKGSDLNDLNGTIDFRQVAITKNDTIYTIDSLLFASISDTGSKSIDIHSPFFAANFKGNIGIGDLPGALQDHFYRYLNMDTMSVKEPEHPQNFTFKIELKNSDLYSVLIPGLKKFVPGTINGDFDSEQERLNVSVSVPQVQYNSLLADSINVAVNSDSVNLRYNVSVGSVSNGDYTVSNTELKGHVAHDSATVRLTIADSDEKLKYLLAGELDKENPGWRFHLLSDSVVLNYESWDAAPDNYLLLGNKSLYVHNLSLTKGDQALIVQSNDSTATDTSLGITFRDFNIKEIASILQSEKDLAGGLMNGNLEITNGEQAPAFKADLSISNFSFREDTLGDIKVLANNETAGSLSREGEHNR